ncbi:hypothetical protein FRB99_007701 [Tulasnella sp. 403]|nr:hypothetical protein FRB99_007701 [Tulasnella sp. 403]
MMAREPVDSVFEPLPAPVDPRDYEHQRGWDEPPSDDERLAQRPIPAEEPRTVPRRAAPSDEGPRYPSANTRQTHSRIFSEAGSLGINERLTVGKPSTAFSSHHPVDSEDPSLARFYREHVSPPRQVRNYIAFICDREKIHPSRVELFINMISEETGTEELVQLNKNMTLRKLNAEVVPLRALPQEYYTPFLSQLTKSRKPNGIRGLYPLEDLPGMISLLAGKPASQTFPVTSISLTVRSPFDPKQEKLLEIKGDALSEALQYTPTKGIPGFQKWVYGLQEMYHKRLSGEGWTVTVGGGSQDLLYKAFHALLNPGDPIFIEAPIYA